MSPRTYRLLMAIAIVMTFAWVGSSAWDYFAAKEPGDYAYHAGSNYFADGDYEQALRSYREALAADPNHLPALRGQAESLIVLGEERQALGHYQRLLEQQPSFAGFYLANMGIAYDRLGEHEQALLHYQRALASDEEVSKGPGWLTRFFRKQVERPPGIAERAGYLREQLSLPPEQRVLRQPAVDQTQRPYKR